MTDTSASQPGSNPQQLVSDYWGVDRRQARPVSWLEHPVALQRLHERVSGDPLIGTAQYWYNRYFSAPAGLCLSIGCGFGALERSLISAGMVEHFHAHDLSENAVARARREAEAAGLGDRIDYRVTDLNSFSAPAETYDAIFGISSIHHVFALENLFAQCRQALKPGALLFLDEYIGPSRFQCTPFVSQAINRILQILPESYRRSVFAGGAPVVNYQNSSISHFEATDPSEAIRSAEIIPTLKLYFDIIDFRPYGGAILHMLLSGLAGNFDEHHPRDVALLKAITLIEELLEEVGAIEPDFAAIVAKPKV